MEDKQAKAVPDEPAGVAGGPEQVPADPYGLARELRAQAAAIEAQADDGDHIRLRVEPPHTSFGYGGVFIGREWTAVHRSLAPGVLRAAAETAGVTVIQEG